ncbi:FGGY carbohydrate kinase domain-containing protein [Galdieria sulphuraria]|nr:FGGY carbohydrate kinase domain-containing protein [Galdieria sulphuraria]
MANDETYFIGVDVGTGSVRAGIFNIQGLLIESFEKAIQTQNLAEDFYEQSSQEIWDSVVYSVREALKKAHIESSAVKGLGFAATCSLVCLDAQGKPVGVSPYNTEDYWNVILWMDHRATQQAERITATGHRVLKYFGNKVSPENELPKILWLKENLANKWNRIAHFMDLCDFLTFQATRSTTRSICPLVCKSGYLASDQQKTDQQKLRLDDTSGWDETLLNEIGLEEIVKEGYRRIGTEVAAPGTPLKNGLCETAAMELGLEVGTPVGSSMVDAHAGGVGILGAVEEGNKEDTLSSDSKYLAKRLEERLAMIAGTSTCYMASSSKPVFVPGVWGPYYSAMIPNMWLSEGGESATGKLLEFIVTNHCQYPFLSKLASEKDLHVYEILNYIIFLLAQQTKMTLEEVVSSIQSTNSSKMKQQMNNAFLDTSPGESKGRDNATLYDEHFSLKCLELTKNLHILPYFHGNRAPYADPTLRGMISGLGMDNSIISLAKMYFATLQALCYGARHLVQVLNGAGHRVQSIYLCGGGMASNKLFLQQLSDSVGCPVVIPVQNQYAVMRGAAMLGAVASTYFSSFPMAMQTMSKVQQIIYPKGQDSLVKKHHDLKFQVFLLSENIYSLHRRFQ